MNTTQNSQMAWTVAGVLAVLVVILLGVMAYHWHVNKPQDLSQVLQSGKVDIAAVRDQIRMDCAKTDADSKKQCAADLQTLGDTLREFSSNVAHATTTPQ